MSSKNGWFHKSLFQMYIDLYALIWRKQFHEMPPPRNGFMKEQVSNEYGSVYTDFRGGFCEIASRNGLLHERACFI